MLTLNCVSWDVPKYAAMCTTASMSSNAGLISSMLVMFARVVLKPSTLDLFSAVTLYPRLARSLPAIPPMSPLIPVTSMFW